MYPRMQLHYCLCKMRSRTTRPTYVLRDRVSRGTQCRKKNQEFCHTSHLRSLLTGTALEVGIQRKTLDLLLSSSRAHDSGLLVLPDALLEEVRLALQGNELHPVEGVRRAEQLRVTQRGQQAVGHELNVPGHQLAVHADAH